MDVITVALPRERAAEAYQGRLYRLRTHQSFDLSEPCGEGALTPFFDEKHSLWDTQLVSGIARKGACL